MNGKLILIFFETQFIIIKLFALSELNISLYNYFCQLFNRLNYFQLNLKKIPGVIKNMISYLQNLNVTQLENQFFHISNYVQMLHPNKKSYEIFANYLGKQVFYIHTTESLNISNKKLDSKKIKQLFSVMKSALIPELYLGNNENTQMLKMIQPIIWKSLKVVQLSKNNISSIQPLRMIKSIQNIQILLLGYNQITSMKSLKCLNLKKLKTLSLIFNKINKTELQKLNCPSIIQFDFEHNNLFNETSSQIKYCSQTVQILCRTQNSKIVVSNTAIFKMIKDNFVHNCPNLKNLSYK